MQRLRKQAEEKMRRGQARMRQGEVGLELRDPREELPGLLESLRSAAAERVPGPEVEVLHLRAESVS